jgi:signal transduction histidine kinase
VAVGILTAIATLGWSSDRALRQVEAESARQRAALAAGIAASLDERLARVFGALQELATAARTPLSERAPVPDRALQSAALDARFLDTIFVLDMNGAVNAQEPAAAAPPDLRLVSEPLRRVLASGVPDIATFTEASDQHVILLLVPVRDWSQRLAGAAGGVIDPAGRHFAQFARAALATPLAGVSLLDARSHVVASSGRTTASPATTLTPAAGDIVTPLQLAPWRVVIASGAGVGRAAFLRTLGWLAPALVAASLLFAWGAGRSVARPLKVLTTAAERIAWGDLHVAIPSLGRDEVGRLATAFERMRRALGASLEKVAATNAMLETRVADRTRELAAANAALQEREAVRQQLLRKVISAQEDERKRLARELHDDTAQMLTALGVRLDLAAEAPPETRDRELREARALAKRSLDELRRLMHDLRPSVLDDLGLVPALEWYADRHLRARGIDVRFDVAPLPERLPVELETALFRAAQEALVNVARHARADTVVVEIGTRGAHLRLDIEDDGAGFDVAGVAPKPGELRGLGLMGMRERIELFGGQVLINSSPGRGTHVVITVPLPDPSAATAATVRAATDAAEPPADGPTS